MSDRPILFSGPMVRAILDGRKTQTRRILKPQPPIRPEIDGDELLVFDGDQIATRQKLRWLVGDRLWVRETWCNGPIGRDGVVDDWSDYIYRASNPEVEGIDDGDGYRVLNADGSVKSCWKPSIHMPRRASRLTLTVTDVRVQRLQDISDDDADAEGFGGDFPTNVLPDVFPGSADDWGHLSMPECFGVLWDSINGKRPGAAWCDNPWIIALTFTVAKQNIDALQMEAA